MDLVEGTYTVYIEPPFDSEHDNVQLEDVSITKQSPRIDYQYSGFQVQGSVLDPEGAPLDSGFVAIAAAQGDFYSGTRVRGGMFSITVPHTGTYAVRGFPNPSNMPASEEVSISVNADTVITLRIVGIPLSGTVFGPGGSGLAGARITAANEESYSYGITDESGVYRFWLREGGYRFRITPPSSMAFILDRFMAYQVVTGPATLDASLDGTHWSGHVRASSDSSAIQSVSVWALMIGDYYERTAIATTGSDGTFELVLEPGREYDLTVGTLSMTGSTVVRGLIAGADSTFDIYVDVPGHYGSPAP